VKNLFGSETGRESSPPERNLVPVLAPVLSPEEVESSNSASNGSYVGSGRRLLEPTTLSGVKKKTAAINDAAARKAISTR